MQPFTDSTHPPQTHTQSQYDTLNQDKGDQWKGKEDEEDEEGRGGGWLIANKGSTDSETIEAGEPTFRCACALSSVAAPDIVRAPLMG